jgi:glycosyltransferase involved in cell wall biosynthesis
VTPVAAADGPRTTAILPALNEEASIGRVVAGLVGRVDEILVVDNGSTDETASEARSAGARVVTEPVPGFGSACYAGTVAAEGEILAFLDADGSFASADVERVLAPVAADELDLCLGTRTRRGSSAMSGSLRVANLALGQAVRVAGAPALTDLGPLRAIRRDRLLALDVADRAFGWPLEMILRSGRAGLRIGEIPVAYLPRIGGESKVTGSLRGSLRVVRQMSRLLAREVRS